MIAEVIVLKFGGTSVGSADRIRAVVDIVRQQRDRRPVVVVSAHAGVTDRLVQLVEAAPRGDALAIVQELDARHREILAELEIDPALLRPFFTELADLARGLRLVGIASKKAADRVLSLGERCSARTVAAALTKAGLPSRALDAFDAGLVTDSDHGRARPLPDNGEIARAVGAVASVGIPVITGFIGADVDGNITTLGRDGSDYSAALFGAALAATEIQIWKDVDGVRTADPRLVPAARPIRAMSYRELRELSSFGSRVVHPGAMLPAMARGIPIFVKNTGAPELPGTKIHGGEGGDDADRVTAIAHRRGIALVTLTAAGPRQQHAFLGAVFGALAETRIDVGPLTVSEGAVTFVLDAGDVSAASERLAAIGAVEVVHGRALLGVVGRSRAIGQRHVVTVLSTLRDLGIEVACAGQGATGATVAAVIAAAELPRAVAALHERCFQEAPA